MNEPQHIRAILPDLMADIESRMDRQRKSQHRRRVISAVGDFLTGKLKRQERRKEKSKFAEKSEKLFEM